MSERDAVSGSATPMPIRDLPLDSDGWVMTWRDVGTLHASADGSTSSWSAAENAQPALERRVRQGMARAFLARLGGQLAFHAGAVAWGDRGVLLVGPSGGGKSTTVAALCKSGAWMLADDAAVLAQRDGEPWLVPGEDRHWLRSDARESLDLVSESEEILGKVAVATEARAATGARLVAIVSLRFTDAGSEPVRVKPVVGAAAFVELLPALLRFVFDDPAVHRSDTDRLADLVAAVPCYVLERPRGHASLDEVGRVLAKIVEPR